MRLLLDTHVLLWALAEPRRLPAEIRRELDLAEVFVSAASIWEIAIKYALGRIDFDPSIVYDGVEPAGLRHLAVSGRHAAHVAYLPPLHKDPFDRLLVAQALVEPMRLLTNDRNLLGYGGVVHVL